MGAVWMNLTKLLDQTHLRDVPWNSFPATFGIARQYELGRGTQKHVTGGTTSGAGTKCLTVH